MFKRRTPLTSLQLLKEILLAYRWAGCALCDMSGCVLFVYLIRPIGFLRVLATGAAVSFTPLLGTHFIQSGAISYLFGFNFIASLIGTFVGNPWTFPFIWWASMTFGSFVLGVFGLPASVSLPEVINFGCCY